MKIQKLLSVLLLSITIIKSQAQTEVPSGYKKGLVVLPDSTVITGFIKDNIRRNTSVVMIPEPGGKKKTYTANELMAAQVDNIRFLCISGDFFEVISEGDLYYVQKSSNASGSVQYNGTEAVYVSSTRGKPGDFFTYDNKSRQLTPVAPIKK